MTLTFEFYLNFRDPSRAAEHYITDLVSRLRPEVQIILQSYMFLKLGNICTVCHVQSIFQGNSVSETRLQVTTLHLERNISP